MKKVVKVIVMVLIIVALGGLGCFIANKLGLDNLNKLKEIINNGISGAIIYIILLTLQVVFIPVNSLTLIIPAILIFGSIKAFFLTWIALVLGSIGCFLLGRLFGKNVVGWLTGKDNVDKIQNKLGKNGKYMLPILLLIPIFPDDITCTCAGLTNMKIWYFICVVSVTRAIDIAATCFLGAVIPFHGWWLLLWAVIIIAMLIIAVIATKKSEQIERFVENLKFKHETNFAKNNKAMH